MSAILHSNPGTDIGAIIRGRAGDAALETLLARVGEGVLMCDRDASHIYANTAARRILHLTEDTIPRGTQMDVVLLHDFEPLPPAERPLARALRGEVTRDLHLLVRHPGSEESSVIRMCADPVRDESGEIIAACAVFSDEGERRRAEEELRAANTRLNGLVAELERRARITILMNDMADLLQSSRTMKEFCLVVSRFAGRIFANQPGAVYMVNASRSAIEVAASWGEYPAGHRVFAPESCWALRRGRLHRGGGPSAFGPPCDHGEHGDAGFTCIPMMGHGEALGVLTVGEGAAHESDLHGVMSDSHHRTIIAVAEHIGLALANVKLRETLRMQAIRDPLTGLFNRRYMEESLDREIARAERNGGSLCAVMIDIDHFKRFNDTFGHASADVALRETAGIIRTNMRPEDIACRFGGEEMVVILPDTSLAVALERTETLRAAIAAQQIRSQGTALGVVTASFGVACFPDDGMAADGLLRAADKALYRAKAEGRNRVCATAAGAPSPAVRLSVAPAAE